jgi:hypothetical protein
MPELPAASPAPLSAAQRSKIRRLVGGDRSEEGAGELNVVPYMDVVMNLTMFVLATVSVIFVSSVETQAAALNPGRPYQPATLGLTVLVTEQGVSMKTAAGNVATGCAEGGSGIAVPKRDGQQDLATPTLPLEFSSRPAGQDEPRGPTEVRRDRQTLCCHVHQPRGAASGTNA